MPEGEQGPRGLGARSAAGRPQLPVRAAASGAAAVPRPAAPDSPPTSSVPRASRRAAASSPPPGPPADPPADPPVDPAPAAGQAPPAKAPARRRRTPAAPQAKPPAPQAKPGTDLVPMTTVDAMERLSGELYVAGQRAARAEAVAEMRLRRLGDVEERNAGLEQELERLRAERQELLQRLALAEARVMVLDDAPRARWGLRRRG